jgi:hypothetical protein
LPELLDALLRCLSVGVRYGFIDSFGYNSLNRAHKSLLFFLDLKWMVREDRPGKEEEHVLDA